MKKVIATSFERYNGGVKVKRLHGSSTVTKFYVHYEGADPHEYVVIEAMGPTPGERKTAAINKFLRRCPAPGPAGTGECSSHVPERRRMRAGMLSPAAEIEAGRAVNLDALTRDELAFVRDRFMDTPQGLAPHNLARYAALRYDAIGYRLHGDIAKAMADENLMDLIYQDLPADYKW